MHIILIPMPCCWYLTWLLPCLNAIATAHFQQPEKSFDQLKINLKPGRHICQINPIEERKTGYKFLFSILPERMWNTFLPISCMCEREHSEHFPNVIMVARSTVKSLEGKKLDQSFTARFNNTMEGQASVLSFSF